MEEYNKKRILKFPEGFLWGAATSAYQVEGGIENNDWAQAAKNGLVPPAGRACDHYNRFREDFDIARDLNNNAHRFSIEWSRIEPEKGKFNLNEIQHYYKVLKLLQERDLEPFITLWHWTIPIWLVEEGGVLAKNFPEYFARYAEFVLREFGNGIKFIMTLNEPTSVIGNGYFAGIWPPFKKNPVMARKAYVNLARAHNLAYDKLRNMNSGVQIGVGHILKYEEPYDDSSVINRVLVGIVDYITNKYFFKLTRNKHDWIGVQYYFHEKFKLNVNNPQKFFMELANDNEWVSDIGWEIYPRGIYHVINQASRFNKPIYITENGVADAKDVHRGKFIKEHLRWIYKAIEQGADVRGYFYWSLLDNYEWASGYGPRFGLVKVDYDNMKRRIRKSARAYAKIAGNNSITVN